MTQDDHIRVLVGGSLEERAAEGDGHLEEQAQVKELFLTKPTGTLHHNEPDR